MLKCSKFSSVRDLFEDGIYFLRRTTGVCENHPPHIFHGRLAPDQAMKNEHEHNLLNRLHQAIPFLNKQKPNCAFLLHLVAGTHTHHNICERKTRRNFADPSSCCQFFNWRKALDLKLQQCDSRITSSESWVAHCTMYSFIKKVLKQGERDTIVASKGPHFGSVGQ